jgi:hypothetical protein
MGQKVERTYCNIELETKLKEDKVESTECRMGHKIEWEIKTDGHVVESNKSRLENKDERTS